MSQLAKDITGAIKGKAEPLFIFHDRVIPAASVYTTIRNYEQSYRELELNAGDRIVIQLNPSVEFLGSFLAALRMQLTAVVLPVDANERLIAMSDARLHITHKNNTIDEQGLPVTAAMKNQLRRQKHRSIPDAAIMLATSGSTGASKLVALSADSIKAVIDSHRHHTQLNEKRILSVLPWHHAFGLVLELLTGILQQATFVRIKPGRPDIQEMLQLAYMYDCNAFFSVPLLVKKLMQQQQGADFLHQVKSGIIGGATIDHETAAFLSQTNLQTGYGQTEASPGILLSESSEFYRGFIGRPSGCETKIINNTLHFKGKNIALGEFSFNGFREYDRDSWFNTGDVVSYDEKLQGYFFRGRKDDQVKLSNGRKFYTGVQEARLIEHFDEIDRVLVLIDENDNIQVLFSAVSDDNFLLKQKLEKFLEENLSSFTCNVTQVANHDFIYDKKGAVDRIAMTSQLTSHAE